MQLASDPQTASSREFRPTALVVTLVVSLICGCADLFRAHPNAVAWVEDQELSVQRLGELMVLGQPLPLEEPVAREMARHWVDVTTMALRLASGDSLWNEDFVREAMWLNLRRLAVSRWRGRVSEEQLTISPTAVDSTYRAGEHRMVAHILRTVPPTATPEVRQQQRAAAEQIRADLVAGMSWEDANLRNEDSLTRDQNGSLGVTGRGTFVPRFENVVYELGPGDLSRVVETQAGYHVIFRPRLENVREPYAAFVEQILRARFDSTYQEDVITEYEVHVPSRGLRSLREIAAEPFANYRPSETAVSFTGGSLTAQRVAQYVRLLPAQTQDEMTRAPDDDLSDFLRGLALEEILWHKADSAGLQASDSTVALMVQNYRGDLRRLWNQMGIPPDSLQNAASELPRDERVATLVDRYFEAAVSRRIPLQPVPGFLVAKLREGVTWNIDRPGLLAAVELARRLQAGAGPPQTDGGPQ